MTTKLAKIYRQQQLLDRLNNDTFQKEPFLAEFHIRDRTLRRDLNELAEQGEIYEERLAILRKKCLGKLTKKVHDGILADHHMVTIALSGATRKAEINEKIDITHRQIIVKAWKPIIEPAK